MSKKRQPKRHHESGWVKFLKIFADIFTILVDRLGAPLAIFIIIFGSFIYYGTQEQKYYFFDMYLLGRDIDNIYPHLVMVTVSIIIIFAQRHQYIKLIREYELEIERLAAWKSAHEENKIGKKLHHGKNPSNK